MSSGASDPKTPIAALAIAVADGVMAAMTSGFGSFRSTLWRSRIEDTSIFSPSNRGPSPWAFRSEYTTFPSSDIQDVSTYDGCVNMLVTSYPLRNNSDTTIFNTDSMPPDLNGLDYKNKCA